MDQKGKSSFELTKGLGNANSRPDVKDVKFFKKGVQPPFLVRYKGFKIGTFAPKSSSRPDVTGTKFKIGTTAPKSRIKQCKSLTA